MNFIPDNNDNIFLIECNSKPYQNQEYKYFYNDFHTKVNNWLKN